MFRAEPIRITRLVTWELPQSPDHLLGRDALVEVAERGVRAQCAHNAAMAHRRRRGSSDVVLRVLVRRRAARCGPTVVESLRARGHEVRVVEAWSDLMGHAQVIGLDADGLGGGSDPRAAGAALRL